MLQVEADYLDILEDCLCGGRKKDTRNGVRYTLSSPRMLQHDMSYGFPALLTKRVAFKSMAVELEGFIQGITHKKWYQDRGCTIWDEWQAPGAHLGDLGPFYGAQWRRFNQQGLHLNSVPCEDLPHCDYDQLARVLEMLHKDPGSTRGVVSAWNPLQLEEMALPPCHVMFKLSVVDGHLNLCWFQRSCDIFLGIPFNLASYALLLALAARHLNLIPGTVTGFLDDVHLYASHEEAAKEQLSRRGQGLLLDPPKLELSGSSNLFHWTHADAKLVNYLPMKPIKAEVVA